MRSSAEIADGIGRKILERLVRKLTGADPKAIALRFVFMFGVIGLFADFT